MGSDYLDLRAETISGGDVSQDSLYQEAADAYGSSLDRLARAYEFDRPAPGHSSASLA